MQDKSTETIQFQGPPQSQFVVQKTKRELVIDLEGADAGKYKELETLLKELLEVSLPEVIFKVIVFTRLA